MILSDCYQDCVYKYCVMLVNSPSTTLYVLPLPHTPLDIAAKEDQQQLPQCSASTSVSATPSIQCAELIAYVHNVSQVKGATSNVCYRQKINRSSLFFTSQAEAFCRHR